jgi:hypothetical protein
MDEQVTIDQLIDAAAGMESSALLEEINESAAADKVGDAEAFAAMLAKASADPDYAATVCGLGAPEASPLMAPA